MYSFAEEIRNAFRGERSVILPVTGRLEELVTVFNSPGSDLFVGFVTLEDDAAISFQGQQLQTPIDPSVPVFFDQVTTKRVPGFKVVRVGQSIYTTDPNDLRLLDFTPRFVPQFLKDYINSGQKLVFMRTQADYDYFGVGDFEGGDNFIRRYFFARPDYFGNTPTTFTYSRVYHHYNNDKLTAYSALVETRNDGFFGINSLFSPVANEQNDVFVERTVGVGTFTGFKIITL